MVMRITEQDVKELENFASLTAAIKLNIADSEFMSIDDRIKLIELRNQELFVSLNSFIKAYRDWYIFHKTIDLQNKQGALNAEEAKELSKLIDEKEKTRIAFLKNWQV